MPSLASAPVLWPSRRTSNILGISWTAFATVRRPKVLILICPC